MKGFLTILLLSATVVLFGQDKPKKYSVDGYLSYLNTNTFDSLKNPWSIDNELYNRLNFSYFLNDDLTFTVQFRNRLIYGNTMLLIPSYSDFTGKDYGFVDMSFNVIDEKNLIFNVFIDRLNFTYSKGNLEVELGRQRINWGRTLVWNPNDFFNSYSYFDFNYEEKPGSDALRINYFTGPVSSVEFAMKVNSDNRATVAAKWLVNKWNYDFQIIAGEMNQRDYVAGFGWAGNIKNLGFKGETSLFYPIDPDSSANRVFSATASLDYMFANSFMIMAQLLYTTIPDNSPIQNFSSYYYAQLNSKYLSFTEWNIFAQMSYPVTPLLNASLSGMYYPEIKGFFVNPMLTYSLSDNVEAGLIWQYFKGEFPDAVTGIKRMQQINMAFLRFKWNF